MSTDLPAAFVPHLGAPQNCLGCNFLSSWHKLSIFTVMTAAYLGERKRTIVFPSAPAIALTKSDTFNT